MIFETRWFHRWAYKHGLSRSNMCTAVREMMLGLHDAELGGGLFKKRVARAGQGKRGGFRTLVATNKGSRWIFVYGFAKSERANIDRDEEEALKKLAAHLLGLTAQALDTSERAGELIKVICDAKDQVLHPRSCP